MTASIIEIELNGESTQVPEGLTIETLLAHLGIPLDRVAVELNRAIVRKQDWAAASIAPGSQVEVVHFVGGGAR